MTARRQGRYFVPALFLLAGVALGCTIGSFGPASTADGRPMLWKNRDVQDENQEMRFLVGKRFSYVTNVYANDTLDAWAGINEAGFAIMNSNSFNLGGFDGKADDGTVMNLALATCANVDDFAKLLDSLNLIGRETQANFGVFDATGMTAMFEASNTYYTRFNAADDSLGMLLRANYSMSGSPNRQTGLNRFLRAQQVASSARRSSRIDAKWVVQELARDLGQVKFDPYPLPFEDRFGELAEGYLPTDSTLCRRTTRSVEVMVGPGPGCPGSGGMMWVMLGPAEISLPVPLWVQAGPVHELLNGPDRSLLCDEALKLHDYIHSDPSYPDAVNTWRLVQLYERFAPVESTIFSMVARSEEEWGPAGPGPEQAREVSAAACEMVLRAYVNYWDWVNRDANLPTSRYGALRNVSRDTVMLRLPQPVASGRVRVFDALGRQVADIGSDNSLLRLSAANLGSGAYFFVLPESAAMRPVRFVFIR